MASSSRLPRLAAPSPDDTARDRFELVSDLVPRGDQPKAIEQLVRGLRRGYRYQTLLGVTGSGKTFTMAHVVAAVQRPTLVISPNKTLAAQLVSEFRDLFPRNAVEYFVSYYDYYQPEAYVPAIDLYIEKDASINEEIETLRHRATQALATRRDVLIVASVSCIYGLGSPELYRSHVLNLQVGEKYPRRDLLRRLVGQHYERNDLELKRGRFRVQGSRIDVVGAGNWGHHLYFDGDTLTEIREFALLTGQEGQALPALSIFPATHFLAPEDQMEPILTRIEAELRDRVAELQSQGKLLEAQRLKARTEYDLEMIRETGYCTGIENYARYFSGRGAGEPPYTLLDFFPPDALLLIDESHVTIPQLRGMYEGDRSRKQNLVDFGWRLPSCRDNRPLRWPEFLERVPQAIFVSATPGPLELKLSAGRVVEQIIRPTGLVDPEIEVRPLKGHIADLVGELRTRVAKGQRCLVTTLTKSTAEDLANYLSGRDFKVRYLHSEVETLKRVEILRDLRLGVIDVLVGINLLREGLDLPEVSLVAILDADKEGYLRSETSIIQTAGRASRHLEGKVILYADRLTGSMERALRESRRRRQMQVEYNRRHGIVPESVVKEVHSLLSAEAPSGELSTSGLGTKWKKRLPLLLANLEEEMRLAAERLEFEEAARIRDRIRALKAQAATGRPGMARATP
jgi:excinuclease ABC subunit B